VFESGDPGSLGRTLAEALGQLGSPVRREEVRRAIDLRMQGYTYAKTTEGLLSALAALKA
jgi:hypothetical protein